MLIINRDKDRPIISDDQIFFHFFIGKNLEVLQQRNTAWKHPYQTAFITGKYNLAGVKYIRL